MQEIELSDEEKSIKLVFNEGHTATVIMAGISMGDRNWEYHKTDIDGNMIYSITEGEGTFEIAGPRGKYKAYNGQLVMDADEQIILFENVLALVVLLRNENADKKNTFIIRIINVFSVFASPFGAMVLGQLIVGDGTWGLYPEYICINLILYMCVYIILFMIIKKAHITICLYFMLVSVLALTNYFVNMFRGTAFVLMDINSVGTALEVVGNYRFEISTAICLCLFATLIFLL